jgi:hypothetical protein
VSCGLRQAVEIGSKAMLPGAWRFGVGAHAGSLPTSLRSNANILAEKYQLYNTVVLDADDDRRAKRPFAA